MHDPDDVRIYDPDLARENHIKAMRLVTEIYGAIDDLTKTCPGNGWEDAALMTGHDPYEWANSEKEDDFPFDESDLEELTVQTK